MLANVYQSAERLPLLGSPLRNLRYPIKRFVRYYLNPGIRKEWDWRIQDVLSSPDNDFIPRVPHAGRIINDHLVMHNGLLIVPDSYCGEPMRLMLEKNKGVHEPQEERVFMEVLKHMPKGAVMMELGANWGFYSMWFQSQVKESQCFLIEPNPAGLECGKRHFAINRMQGNFSRGFLGASADVASDGTPIFCVDGLVKTHKIEHINILHSDIQGAEADMLRGADATLKARKIDYIFISTHGDEVHEKCRSVLQEHRYVILAEANLQDTFSFDGLIVARREELPGLNPISISKKRHQASR